MLKNFVYKTDLENTLEMLAKYDGVEWEYKNNVLVFVSLDRKQITTVYFDDKGNRLYSEHTRQ